jgi:hypothetical protein
MALEKCIEHALNMSNLYMEILIVHIYKLQTDGRIIHQGMFGAIVMELGIM